MMASVAVAYAYWHSGDNNTIFANLFLIDEFSIKLCDRMPLLRGKSASSLVVFLDSE